MRPEVDIGGGTLVKVHKCHKCDEMRMTAQGVCREACVCVGFIRMIVRVGRRNEVNGM